LINLFNHGIKKLNTTILLLVVFFSHAFSSNAQNLTGPELLYPFNQEVLGTTDITFMWTKDYYNSSTYQIQISTSTDFSSPVIDVSGISNNFYAGSGFILGQNYYWRVRKLIGIQYTQWSDNRLFIMFAPTQISGLSVWLDPAEDVTLNGTFVQNLNDQSGIGNHAQQFTIGQQPLYINSDSLINNRPFIRYDGSNDFIEILDHASIDFVSEFSIHVLVRPTVIATNKTILAKWDYATQGSWAFQTDYYNADELMYAPASSLTDPGGTNVASTDANMLLGEPAILNLVFDGTSGDKIKYYKNFTELSKLSTGVVQNTLPNSTATLKVGKYGGVATRYYNGNIGEVVIYDHKLTSQDQSKVNNYLRYKYSPPVSLGNDTIIAGNNLCGAITLKAQFRYKDYLWSTGATTSTITAVNPGNYWVQVTDYLGNISSDTIIVYPPYNVNKPVSNGFLCINDTINWTTTFPSSDFTFLWQDGSTDTNFLITQTGAYSVLISDLFGCSIQSEILNIQIDDYENEVFIGNDTTLCSGNIIELQIGQMETVSYLWTDFSTNSFLEISNTGIYNVETTNINNCIARDTINVIISGIAPISDFSGANSCFGQVNSFTDESSNAPSDAITNWYWDFGDGQNSSFQNPTHTYLAPGTYTIELYVETVGGCGAFHDEEIIIYTLPTAQFSKSGFCSADAIQFTDQSTQGAGIINSWLWNFGQPSSGLNNVSYLTNPTKIYNEAGSFNVILEVTDVNSCVDQVTMNITVYDSPIASFTAEESCENNNIVFVNNSLAVAPSTISNYLWDFGDFTGSIFPVPTKSFPNYGNHNISLEVTANNGCKSLAQSDVYIHATPNAQIEIGPLCKGTYTTLSDVSTISEGSLVSSFWVINGTDIIEGSPGSYKFDSFGQQQIVLESTSDFGCVDLQNVFVDVVEELNASFTTSSSVVAAGEPISFINTSAGATSSDWNFGDGFSSTVPSPVHEFESNFIDSTMLVRLIVSNALGCVDTVENGLLIRPVELDLELANLYLEENNGLYTVAVQLKNIGIITIEEVDLQVITSVGTLLEETWIGNLNPGQNHIYVFTSKPAAITSGSDEIESFICVEGKAYGENNLEESLLSNNKICKNIEEGAPVLLPVYPNPANGNMTVDLLLTDGGESEIQLVDLQGRIVKQILAEQILNAGFYSFEVELMLIQSGTYFVRLISGDTNTMQKVIVTGLE